MVSPMNWNDAAEDFLNQVLAQTPLSGARGDRSAVARAWRKAWPRTRARQRVGVETVIMAWVQTDAGSATARPAALMEKFGLDPDEYRHLLE